MLRQRTAPGSKKVISQNVKRKKHSQKEKTSARSNLSKAVCTDKRLQLNDDKTEMMWFGSAAKLTKIPLAISNIRIGSIDVQPVTVVRDLGVMIDAELSMRVHVSRAAQTCFYHLRRLRSIRRQLGRDVTARLVSAFVLS